MQRIDRILSNEEYQKHLMSNEKAERNRIFCHHDREHFLNVARIAWILCLEREIAVPKEEIYAAALLHDIGRHRQYEEGISHEIASAQIAPGILRECGFTPEETERIVDVMLSHRDPDCKGEHSFAGVIYEADKLSRACYACAAKEACNWPDSKKNLTLQV